MSTLTAPTPLSLDAATALSAPNLASMSPEEFVAHLDRRQDHLIEEIKASEVFRTLTDPDTDRELAFATIKEIYLEIFSYQPDSVEAAINAIGQMPRTFNSRHVKSMLLHQGEEFDHGEMALRDYLAMDGDEDYARTRRMSPASFAVAGMWRMIAQQRQPFAYLGALYLFESLTPKIASITGPPLLKLGLPEEALEFITFHGVVDVRHSNLIRHLIKEALRFDPANAEAMDHGMSCFLHVYPIPVWSEALRRAKLIVAERRAGA